MLAGALYAMFVVVSVRAESRARRTPARRTSRPCSPARCFSSRRTPRFDQGGLGRAGRRHSGRRGRGPGAAAAAACSASQPAGERDLGRLALVAGAALAFATVAIPLQLRHQWITIGWALEGAALAWLYRRIPHRGLLYSASALLAAVFVRLALNPAIFVYEPRGMRIFNWYLYTYLICARRDVRWPRGGCRRPTIGCAHGAAAAVDAAAGGRRILLFLLLNIEIADFYATGREITFRFGVTLAQDLTYTIGWLIFGLRHADGGIYLHNRAGRVAAVALIAVTTFKAFLYDMGSLGGLYRVGVARRSGDFALAGRAGAAEVRAAGAEGSLTWSTRRRLRLARRCRRSCGRARLRAADAAAAGVPLRASGQPVGGGPRRLAIDVPLLVGGNPFASVRGVDGAPASATRGAGLTDLRFFDPTGREVAYLLVPNPPASPSVAAGGDPAVAPVETRQDQDERLRSRPRRADARRPVPRRRHRGAVPEARRASKAAAIARIGRCSSRRRRLRSAGRAAPPHGNRVHARHLPLLPRHVGRHAQRPRRAAGRAAVARVVATAVPPPALTAPRDFRPARQRAGPQPLPHHAAGRHLPIVALELDVGGEHVLRRATVYESRLSGAEAAPMQLGAATLRRVVQDTVAAASLRVPIRPPSEAQLDLDVDDGDNPPLDLQGVTAVFAALPWIYFESGGRCRRRALRQRHAAGAALRPRSGARQGADRRRAGGDVG